MSLLIAAASDLAPLELDLIRLAGQPCRFTFGSSGMLSRQIANGAPYDVFLSADEKYAPGGRIYAIGRIGLWSRTGLRELKDLGASSVRWVAIANPDHAPYGRAARQALERTGVWKAVDRKIVLGENVRQAFQFAESGNADACVVAWTLIYRRSGILIESRWHDAIRQSALVVAGSKQAAAARAFLDRLTGEPGRALLKTHGFEIP